MKENTRIKRNILFHSLGNFVAMLLHWSISILLVKLSGYHDAGIWALCITFGNIIYAMASFGMRGIHASDVSYEFDNDTYIKSRLITCFGSIIVFIIFIVFNGYSLNTKLCIIFYLLYQCVEAFDEVFYGAMQREGNMEKIGISYALHGITMFIAFFGGWYVSHSLLLSTFFMFLSSLLVTFLYDNRMYHKICPKEHRGKGTLRKLFAMSYPMVIYIFAFNNIQAFPKYYFERIYDQELLGIYSSIATLVLLVQVFASYIFYPLLNVLAQRVKNHDHKGYLKLIHHVLIFIFILGFLGLLYIHFFGNISLKIILGEESVSYSYLLTSTLFVAILLSILSFMNMVLTATRKIKYLIIGNLSSLIVTMIASIILIPKCSLNGINYATMIGLLFGILMISKEVYHYDKKESKQMKKIKAFLIRFGVKHSKTITKLVPNFLINKLEMMANKNMGTFRRTEVFDQDLKDGVNFAGYIDGQFGLGQGSRLLLSALTESDLDFSAINITINSNAKHGDTEFQDILSHDFSHKINLFHIQPYTSFEIGLSQIGIDNLKGRYNIGYWVYELEDIPKKWSSSFEYVNEIWTPSDFATNAFKKIAPVPVRTIPYGIKVKKDDKLTRKDFDIPEDKFAFLIMYDPRSLAERKNPKAAIDAYLNAFHNCDEVCLVVVLNSATEEEIRVLEKELIDVKHYTLINRTLPKDELYALISLCDVYVSLHRSEGFGLILGEAMALGTVCIATNYSGNLDFMNEKNSCLVKYEMIAVDTKTQRVYEEGNYWADADVQDASQYMKKLFSDQAYYKRLKKQAKKDMEEKFSIKASKEKIEKRIQEILKEMER